jgi:CRP-like cAMP-binding protein
VEVITGAGAVERRVNVLGAGDYFGEMALLSDQSRTATVRTRTPVQLLTLTRADFRDLLDSAPAVRQSVEQTIAFRRAMLRAMAPAEAAVALPA